MARPTPNRHPRLRWCASHLPAIRADFCDRTDQLLTSRPHAADDRAEVRHLRAAELYWTATQMVELSLDAALDVPAWDWDDRPCDDGLLALETPLPPITVTTETRTSDQQHVTAAIHAVSWVRSRAHTSITLYALSDALPDGLPGGLLREVVTMTVTDDRLALDQLTNHDNPYYGPGQQITQLQRSVLSWLSAAWVLMQTPGVGERTRSQYGADGRPRPAGAKPDRRRQVTLVALRALPHTPSSHDSSGRVLRHRFVVRGHWKLQPHGPGNTQRRLVYIAPYIKGPADAPLLRTDRVHVWRH